MQGPLGAGTLVALIVVAGALIAPQAASAEITSVFGGDVGCTTRSDGVRVCDLGSDPARSTVPAWDGVPIDVDAAFPPAPSSGPDGNYPLIMLFHGYGGQKIDPSGMRHWLDRGYATFSMTDRGFHESCGSQDSRDASGGACDNGYIRLIDNRYEVRDAQEFAGQLADEGLIDPQRIGSIGGSYGGGMSMALGALRNRMVMPDYSVVPWASPDGTPMQIAAASPNIPWTDLAYSLQPNGSTLDYVADAPYTGPVGVEKQSLVGGLYFSGQAAPGFYAPVGTDPTADITGWRNSIQAGEPYGAESQTILDEITQHHSSYYIDHSIAPAPMLMSSGFTDDLFPASETIRYYNRTKTQYPDAHLALFFGDFGHPRAQNKPDVTGALGDAQDAWMDHWVKGEGAQPPENVTAYTLTCPESAPSGGPYVSSNWAKAAPGEIRFHSDQAVTIDPSAGSEAIAKKFNPVGGDSACATADGADQAGSATYRLDRAPAGGYTMLGSPTVIAAFTLPGDTSQVAARLLDVAPDGQETLVSRGLWRPATGGPTKQVFQLSEDGWHFAEGHVPKLELLPKDTDPGLTGGYGRASDDQQPVTVSNLKLRLPVVERPGSQNGLVKQPAPRMLPDGFGLASDFAGLPDLRPTLDQKNLKRKRPKLFADIRCPTEWASCNNVDVKVTTKAPDAAKKPKKVASRTYKLDLGGNVRKVGMKLTKKAKRYLRRHPKLKVYVQIGSKETATAAVTKATAVAKGKGGTGRGY